MLSNGTLAKQHKGGLTLNYWQPQQPEKQGPAIYLNHRNIYRNKGAMTNTNQIKVTYEWVLTHFGIVFTSTITFDNFIVAEKLAE